MPYRTSLRRDDSSVYLLAHNTGKNDQIIFRTATDYEQFLITMKKLLHTTDSVSLIGFSLLQNSFYLVFREDVRGAAAKFIQRMSISYSIYFNSRYMKTGKVFQSPYKDTLLGSDDEIMRALCKVHRLPEQQQENIETYKWSSYHFYLARRGTWLDKSFVQLYFATTTYQEDLRNMTTKTEL